MDSTKLLEILVDCLILQNQSEISKCAGCGFLRIICECGTRAISDS